MRILAVEGRPVVVEGDLLPPGTEILAVDGEPAARVRARLAATIESSNRHFTEAATAARILRGPAGTTVNLTVRRWDGSEYEVALKRTGPLLPPDRVDVDNLGEGRLRVTVNTFGEMEVAGEFHRRFPDFDGVTGLIIDLRRNHGGSSAVAHSILARLLTAPAQSARVQLRTYIPVIRAWGGTQRWIVDAPDQILPDSTRPSFTGPVALLTSPFTASAAEEFLVAFRAAGRGSIIGEPSYGSAGEPLVVRLPGGGALRVCCTRETMPDGERFVGKGIAPDIPCAPTITGIASGRDEVLEAAISQL